MDLYSSSHDSRARPPSPPLSVAPPRSPSPAEAEPKRVKTFLANADPGQELSVHVHEHQHGRLVFRQSLADEGDIRLLRRERSLNSTEGRHCSHQRLPDLAPGRRRAAPKRDHMPYLSHAEAELGRTSTTDRCTGLDFMDPALTRKRTYYGR